MIEVRDHFRKISDFLSAQSAVAGGTGHSVTTGHLRETIIHNFLRPHLPIRLDVRSGVVIDSAGQRSKQQDCVILDNRMPVIDVGSSTEALLIAESVIATVEVKSYLNKKELITSLESSATTKNLIRSGQQSYEKGGMRVVIEPAPFPILTYIFAYDSVDLDVLRRHIIDFAQHKQDGRLIPEAICILKKGVLFRSSHMPVLVGTNATMPFASGRLELTTQPYDKDALLAFYRRLIDEVIPFRLVNYDIDAYYSEAQLE